MGRLIRAEFRKVAQTTFFWIFLAAAALLNGILLYSGRPFRHTSDKQAFRALHAELRTYPTNEEKLAFLEPYQKTLDLYSLFDFLPFDLNDPAYQAYDEAFLAKAYADYAGGSDLLYAGTVSQEYLMVNFAIEQIKTLARYPQTVADTSRQASRILNSGLIEKGSFRHQEVSKTVAAYGQMEGVVPVYDASEGILAATDFQITNFFLLLFLLLLVILLFTTERDDGLLAVIQSTKRGRLATAVSKWVILSLLGASAVLLFFGTNFAVGAMQYGIHDLGRPLQALRGFQNSTLSISIGGFLALFLLFKCLSSFLWAGILAVAALLFRRVWAMASTVLAFFAAMAALSIQIPAYSRLAFWKYINLYTFLDAAEMFRPTLFLNLFGSAASLQRLALWVGGLLLALTVGISVWLSCQKPARSSVRSPARHGRGWAGGVAFFETKKLYWDQAALALLAVLALYQVYAVHNAQLYLNADARLYQSFLLKLEGPDTPEKRAYLAEYELGLVSIPADRAALDEAYANGALDFYEYQTQTARLESRKETERVFARVVSYVDGMDARQTGWFAYDEGYAHLLGVDGRREASMRSILLCAVLILGLSAPFSHEYQSGMLPLLQTTKHGRLSLWRRKRAVQFPFPLLACLLVFLPDVARLYPFMPLQSWAAPASTLSFLPALPAFIPVWAVYGFSLLLRCAGSYAAGAWICWAAVTTRRFLHTALLSAVVLILPCLAALFSLRLLEPVSLSPLFLGLGPFLLPPGFLAGQRSFYFAWVFLFAFLSSFLLLRSARRVFCRLATAKRQGVS